MMGREKLLYYCRKGLIDDLQLLNSLELSYMMMFVLYYLCSLMAWGRKGLRTSCGKTALASCSCFLGIAAFGQS